MSQQASLSTIGGPKTIRQRLATPRAVMILLPALVALVGIVSGVVSYRSMTTSARSMALEGVELAVDQVVHQCDSVAITATQLSEQTRVLLGLRGTDRSVETWGRDFAGLFSARTALTWISVSTPDGVFFGMTREDGGRLRYTIQDQDAGGTRRDWYVDDLAITEGGVRTQTGYDPRKRPFYQAALAKGGPVWTEPYTFFDTGHTGVSLATPVYTEGGGLRAVITVDFTAADISLTLERMAGRLGDRLVVHDAEGAVIAAAGTTVKGRETGRDKPLVLADLGDPLIDAYAGLAEDSGTVTARDGRECLVARRATANDGLAWTVAVVADLRPRLAVANRQLTRTVLITFAVVVAACILAAIYASHLVRMRGIVRAARADAARAQEEAAELGSYVLEKKLGAGGMGEVWRARHRLLARPAALKLIKRDSEAAEEETGAQRFEREARLTASLTSPHTVTVYDFGQLEDGTLFYAMELLEGEDLDAILRRHGKLPQEAVVHVLIQVCDSLHEAHEAGLVHRDLKPANIFVARRGCADDVAKVLDFGLVALAGKRQKAEGPRLTMAGFVQGTPGYMSPEQLRDEELDRRSDLYSLGCVAFWLLTGRAVFPADNLMDELRRHLDEDPPAPSKVAGQPVGEGLDQVILACLARDRAKRPASAADLRRLLLTCGVPPKWAPGLGGGKQAASAAGETTGVGQQVRVKRGKK